MYAGDLIFMHYSSSFLPIFRLPELGGSKCMISDNIVHKWVLINLRTLHRDFTRYCKGIGCQ